MRYYLLVISAVAILTALASRRDAGLSPVMVGLHHHWNDRYFNFYAGSLLNTAATTMDLEWLQALKGQVDKVVVCEIPAEREGYSRGLADSLASLLKSPEYDKLAEMSGDGQSIRIYASSHETTLDVLVALKTDSIGLHAIEVRGAIDLKSLPLSAITSMRNAESLFTNSLFKQ